VSQLAENADKGRPPRVAGMLSLAVALLVCALSARDFLSQRRPEPLVPGAGVTRVEALSRWHPPLAGGRGDTEVYFLEGAAPGGTALVLGGVHPNEPAGLLAAVLLVENARLQSGRMIVIPRSNASAFCATEPQEGHPQRYRIASRNGGLREFRLGSRLSSPLDQWPDPEITIHHPSGQALSGNETRNLNRCFPGRPRGSFTEQVAWSITRLIEDEGVDLLIDLHEASVEYPVINAMVAHERAGDLAAAAVFGLEMRGFEFSLEPSPRKLHGLSHRELGDRFETLYAVLMESANPIQGRLRGRTGIQQIIQGTDSCYVRAGRIGMNQVEFPPAGIPIERRVARHLAGVEELLNALSLLDPRKSIRISDLPPTTRLLREGLGPWLNP